MVLSTTYMTCRPQYITCCPQYKKSAQNVVRNVTILGRHILWIALHILWGCPLQNYIVDNMLYIVDIYCGCLRCGLHYLVGTKCMLWIYIVGNNCSFHILWVTYVVDDIVDEVPTIYSGCCPQHVYVVDIYCGLLPVLPMGEVSVRSHAKHHVRSHTEGGRESVWSLITWAHTHEEGKCH